MFISAKKTPETIPASPQLLSKLFPQTAVADHAELQAEQEKKKREEEGWFDLAPLLENFDYPVCNCRRKKRTRQTMETDEARILSLRSLRRWVWCLRKFP